MTTDTDARILAYIKTFKQVRVADLVYDIRITNSAVHRQLNKLLASGKIIRVGKPPYVFYIANEVTSLPDVELPTELTAFLDANYVYVSPSGAFLKGVNGFSAWVNSINQQRYLLALASEYRKIRIEANNFFSDKGWIDATEVKNNAIFGDSIIDTMLYSDFYSLEKFGKTKLGQMVLYAKVSQNRATIDDIITSVKPTVSGIIASYDIDSIAYIPPSIKRNLQLMHALKKGFHFDLPEIILRKAYRGDIIVSQKSLSKLQERIINAQETIFIDKEKSVAKPNNVLIIDDAIGSGATIHETAKKIKEMLHPTGYIIGYALVGSMKDFEVIREI